MTTYTRPDGTEVVVCDGCGIDHDGNRPDVTKLTPVDQSAGLRQHLQGLGFDEATLQGCGLNIRDTCPDCTAKRKEARS